MWSRNVPKVPARSAIQLTTVVRYGAALLASSSGVAAA